MVKNRTLDDLATPRVPDDVRIREIEAVQEGDEIRGEDSRLGQAGLVDVPAFVPEDESPEPTPVAALRGELAAASAVVFCTPEYAGTLPGSLKNALDWVVGSGELKPPVTCRSRVLEPGKVTDRMLIFGERRLRQVLAVYAAHYVRHEAPLDHVEVKGLHLQAVAAVC